MLSVHTAMCDGPEDFRIEASIASQLFGIHLIALADVPNDGVKFRYIRKQHLMAILPNLFADPNRMSSRLHRNPCSRHSPEMFFDGPSDGSKTSFLHNLRVVIKDAVVAPKISEINADRDLLRW